MIPPLARQFVAGETAAEAIEQATQLNDGGVGAIINHLGEHYEERGPAEADADAYVHLVDDIARMDLKACLSAKPSQLGLFVDERVFWENLSRVVDHAAERDVFVWLDMEDHRTTDATLDAFEAETTKHDGGVGVCLQSNLRRTHDDLARLTDVPGKVRLVKGAYDPPAAIAYQGTARVDARYRNDLRYMFDNFEDGVAVGSHDPEMIALARSLHDEFGTSYEIQMLMGVRSDAQVELADDCEVWQYVPYGDRWLSYFYRRVVERKENALFAARALLGS